MCIAKNMTHNEDFLNIKSYTFKEATMSYISWYIYKNCKKKMVICDLRSNLAPTVLWSAWSNDPICDTLHPPGLTQPLCTHSSAVNENSQSHSKLDKVGPVDNGPSTYKLNIFFF